MSGPAILLTETDVVAHNAAADQLCRSLGYDLEVFAERARHAFQEDSIKASPAVESWQEITWQQGAASHAMRARVVSETGLLLLLPEPNSGAIQPSLPAVRLQETSAPSVLPEVDRRQYKRAEKLARLGSYRLLTTDGSLFVSGFLHNLLLQDVVTPASSMEELLSVFAEDEAEKIRELHSALMRGAKSVSAEVTFENNRGESLVLEIRCECDRNDKGRPSCIYGVAIDVTERVREEQKVRFIAFHDALTGLPNRAKFMDVSARIIERAMDGGESFALHLVDLDGFKEINDTLGHLAGDQVLQLVAQRLTSNIRSDDMAFRFGGDEFAVLHRGIRSPESVEKLGQRLAAKLGEPLEIGTQTIHIGASMGGALFAQDESMQHMMLRADEMLYAVKRSGKGAFRLAA